MKITLRQIVYLLLFLSLITLFHLWRPVDLAAIYQYDHGHYFVLSLILSIVATAKAWFICLFIKIMLAKDLNLSHPFSKKIRRQIYTLSYAALLTGLFSSYGVKYSEWLTKQGASIPDTLFLRLAGSAIWLSIAVALFTIAQFFKREIKPGLSN